MGDNILNHVAIIMDGNARWAKRKKLRKDKGYNQGLKVLKKIINHCIKKNIKILTVYALSSENIQRKDVDLIFNIIRKNFENNNILENFKLMNFNLLGSRKGIPKDILLFFEKLEKNNNNKKKYTFNLAFNYGAWEEIVYCINQILSIYKLNNKNISINENIIKENLYLKNIPDPDLLIRTGGYKRLSNFLLLQLKYSELFFINTLWPDFNTRIFDKITGKYKNINRKYGL